jgi:hypothetical protein
MDPTVSGADYYCPDCKARGSFTGRELQDMRRLFKCDCCNSMLHWGGKLTRPEGSRWVMEIKLLISNYETSED